MSEPIEGMTCYCGLPISKNPHPKAGEMMTLLTVGSEYVCIPCTVKSRHEWCEQARASQRDQINTRLFYGERMDALQRYQKELPEPHRTIVCNILANGRPKP